MTKKPPRPKKSFYDLLWTICEQEGLIKKWMYEGLLGKSRDTYYWTAKSQDEYGYDIIGEKKEGVDDLSEKPDLSKVSLEVVDKARGKKAEQQEKDFVEKVTDNKLDEFISLFSKKNLGIPGKTTSKINVVKRLLKFFKEYPDYTMEDIIEATKLYIENLKKTGSLTYIRECGYFISKKIDGIDQSDLAKWCEEYKSSGGSYTSHQIL